MQPPCSGFIPIASKFSGNSVVSGYESTVLLRYPLLTLLYLSDARDDLVFGLPGLSSASGKDFRLSYYIFFYYL